MIEKLFEEGYLDYQKLIFRNAQRFDLTSDEMVILTHLFNLAEKKRFNLSTNSLARLTGFKGNHVGEIVNSLFEKDLICINLEKKSDDKVGEVFSLKPFFDKISTYFTTEIKKQSELKQMSELEKLVEKLETKFNKALTPTNLDVIRQWPIEGFTLEQVDEAIELAIKHHKKNVNYVDKILRSESFLEPSSIDEKTAQAIRRLIGK
ncbi:MAG: DnaD domain protein [Acholeplasmataceae bacterium]|nr:DnaD domain protein [Acholeplasmataceae bacterium]